MPHVSKKLLQKKDFLKIHNQLFKAISETYDSKAIFNELLTKTEKLMLAKRLATIYMLSKGESKYSIHMMLKVSTSTVRIISNRIELGHFKSLIRGMKSISGETFWKYLERIIPPRTGRNRFKNFLKF